MNEKRVIGHVCTCVMILLIIYSILKDLHGPDATETYRIFEPHLMSPAEMVAVAINDPGPRGRIAHNDSSGEYVVLWSEQKLIDDPDRIPPVLTWFRTMQVVQVEGAPGFWDGIHNSIIVISGSFWHILTDTFWGYLNAFKVFDSWFWDLIWLVAGIPLTLAASMIGCLIAAILAAWKILVIKASAGYYFGFILGIVFQLICFKLGGNGEEASRSTDAPKPVGEQPAAEKTSCETARPSHD